MTNELFPFADYWWIYAGFLVLVAIVLIIDLGVLQKRSHTVSPKEALGWSLVWVTLALCLNVAFYFFALHELTTRAVPDAANTAARLAKEFLSGYVVELALSVDNLFVFVVLFTFFGIPSKYQHRVLFFGVLGALFFRGVFIALGAMVIHIEWVVILLGMFLVFTGLKLLRSDGESVDPEKNPLLRWLSKTGRVTSELHGQKFFIKQNGVWFMTPLFVCLLLIEVTDIVFAVDSVPAIFAITQEPLIVFCSNICAVLGLRSMYFLLASALHSFHLLRFGLSAVLVFIGAKMGVLKPFFHLEIPTEVSLMIILGALSLSMGASLLIKKKH